MTDLSNATAAERLAYWRAALIVEEAKLSTARPKHQPTHVARVAEAKDNVAHWEAEVARG